MSGDMLVAMYVTLSVFGIVAVLWVFADGMASVLRRL